MKKLIAFVLTLFLVFSLVGCETNYETEKVLMENGPWSGEAIWIDNSSQMYLVCTKDNGDQFADVVAYLNINGQWCSARLDLYQGAPVVCFSTSDDERVLEARAKMNEKNLQLYEFKVYDEHFSVQYSDIELSKFSYQEQVDKLPFEIA